MASPLSDGLKIAIVMVIVCSIIATMLYVVTLTSNWEGGARNQLADEAAVDHLSDFTAMSVYGKPIPMPNVVAALDLYGTPEVICVQMEDLKGTLGGDPYPIAYNDEAKIKELCSLLKNYYNKKVYVYTAAPNGLLQLCVSELPHSTNADGRLQNWER